MQKQGFDLPNEELGKLILGYWIAGQAESFGFDPLNIPPSFGERIVEITQQLPDDYASDENDSLMLALRLAANGHFEAAGKKLKASVSKNTYFMAAVDMVSSMDEDTRRGVKVRRSAKIGHEVVHGNAAEKETQRRKYLDLLDEIRRENPTAKPTKVYVIAEAESMEKLGKKVCYKTFERAEKAEKLKP